MTTGYPPDALHDLLEGIVPVELAVFRYLDKEKIFFLEELNRIKQFPCKWKDRTNCPKVNHKTLPLVKPLVVMPMKTGAYVGCFHLFSTPREFYCYAHGQRF